MRHIKGAIWIRRRAPNTMKRDDWAHYLSHVYDPLLATPTQGGIKLFFPQEQDFSYNISSMLPI